MVRFFPWFLLYVNFFFFFFLPYIEPGSSISHRDDIGVVLGSVVAFRTTRSMHEVPNNGVWVMEYGVMNRVSAFEKPEGLWHFVDI